MALREIRLDGDPILRKISKEVTEVTERIKVLLDDMAETMYAADGIGLAAPQVGVLRRVIIVNMGEEEGILELINPEIVETEGECIGVEGCLSIPNKSGEVLRPQKLKVVFMDREGKHNELRLEDLMARVVCHEVDHLNGILYTDKTVDGKIYDSYDDDEEMENS